MSADDAMDDLVTAILTRVDGYVSEDDLADFIGLLVEDAENVDELEAATAFIESGAIEFSQVDGRLLLRKAA